MPLRVGKKVRTKVEVTVRGEVVSVYARNPRTKERRAYESAIMKTKGRGDQVEVESRLSETRQKFGQLIILDIEPGDIIYVHEDGETVLTAKVPGWKSIFLKEAPEVVEAVAAYMFNNAKAVQADEGERSGAGDPDDFDDDDLDGLNDLDEPDEPGAGEGQEGNGGDAR